MGRKSVSQPTQGEPSVRDRFLTTTSRLLELQGYAATGLNQIIMESQAPKGSLYYHFPNGKEQLAAEAIVRQGQALAQGLRTHLASIDDPAEAVRTLAHQIAQEILGGNFCTGGPITATALESSTNAEQLREACAQVYRSWQAVFTEKLTANGYSLERATSLAAICVAAIEGGIVLSRATHDTTGLELIGEELATLLQIAQLGT